MSERLYLISKRVADVLSVHQHKLVTAESCTGGWVAQSMTDIAGSSGWFERGFVTYSNESKQEMLGVSSPTLEVYGAVSRQTVLEMVSGALRNSQAQCALAVSGIAGPDGGTIDKPVGTVWFAWQIEGSPIQTRKEHLTGNRGSIRYQSVQIALQGVLDGYRDFKTMSD